ncbi:hypothetical protein RB2654_14905 [Rhodobacterales bacterium HTCC2654]|uniref:Uncharacterized protein n=1 Tax=Maritimibacter alkaliphilus HTCC2654 TaxID=314271 RepID=A3VH30_9RHOB|nr:hypothetical protein RB2654_14905 [Rhodobacterales bacterium HTCC2654] [Maritimibacter alkaliphilus HTCC2654]
MIRPGTRWNSPNRNCGDFREHKSSDRGKGARSDIRNQRWPGSRAEGRRSGRGQRRFRQLHRAIRLWQDHLSALYRGTGASDGRHADRQRHDPGRGAQIAGLWIRLSGGGTLPLAYHRGQRPPPARDHGLSQVGTRWPDRKGAGPRGPQGFRQEISVAAVRWYAATGQHRARAGLRCRHHADG